MTEKVKKRLEEAKALLHDHMNEQEFNNALRPLEEACREDLGQTEHSCRETCQYDDCPILYLLIHVIDEEITDAVKQDETLVKAKRIINNF